MAGYNPKAGARDMLLSLAVLFIPIILIVWFFQQTPEEPPLNEVDWKGTVATARQEATFPVLAPPELPAQWRATSTYWAKTGGKQGDRALAGDEYSLGLLAADNMHVSLRQTNAPVGPWLASLMRSGHEVGTVDVKGVTWKTWLSADGRTHYLTTQVDDSTVMVSGDDNQQQLVDFAGLLTEG